jgi:alanine-glyoxylate transaminase/serine-glyoxylate transaminase/serine-pyruvate transaminase
VREADIRRAVENKRPKAVAVVHAETSTGARQPLEEISQISHRNGALFIVDTVTSLGGMEVNVDGWGIDAVYSGTQKCLSCPPGLAPLSFGERALEALEKRKTPVASWYLDMAMVRKYWGSERVYHHTAPINMIFALREALRIIHEEGLEARFENHRRNHMALVQGIEALGLEMHVHPDHRLPMLNAVRIPDGVDDMRVRRALLENFSIEIGGGLGELKGRIWRVGLMGHTSRPQNVLTFLGALGLVLKAEGAARDPGAGVKAAAEFYQPQGTP